MLEHPAVLEKLRALTGPYYDRVTAFTRNAFPTTYAPFHTLVLRGQSALSDHGDPTQRDEIIVTVDWDSGNVFAALKNTRETLVFTYLADMLILPEPILYFIREEAINKIAYRQLGDPPAEPHVRLFDFHHDRPEIGKPASDHPPGRDR